MFSRLYIVESFFFESARHLAMVGGLKKIRLSVFKRISGSYLRLFEIVFSLLFSRFKRAECQETVCRLLLAVGPDLLVLGRRCAADLVCTVCAVQAVYPTVWTNSLDDSTASIEGDLVFQTVYYLVLEVLYSLGFFQSMSLYKIITIIRI